MYLERLLNLMPLFEEDGGGTGTGSTPSEPETGMSDEDLAGFEEAFDGEEEPEAEEKPTEEKPTEEAEPKVETTPQTVKVKHNGQEIELTQEQLLNAAQKGMDYDRVRESRDRFMAPIDRLAKQAGMATDQFLVALDGMIKSNAIEGKKNEFISQGVEESIAAQMAEMAYENEQLKSGQAQQQQQMDARTKAQQELQGRIEQEIADFEARFPKVDSLPEEVTDAIKGGESPVVAYQNYLLKQKDAELKGLKQQKKNKETVPGSIRGTGGAKPDLFEEGFDLGMKF